MHRLGGKLHVFHEYCFLFLQREVVKFSQVLSMLHAEEAEGMVNLVLQFLTLEHMKLTGTGVSFKLSEQEGRDTQGIQPLYHLNLIRPSHFSAGNIESLGDA